MGHMLTLAQTHLHTHTFTCTPWLLQTLTPHALTCSHTHTHTHTAPSRTSPRLPASPICPRRLTQSRELRVTGTLKNPAEPPTWGFHLEPRGAGAPWLQGTFWPPLAPHSSPSQDRQGQRPLWRAGQLAGRYPALSSHSFRGWGEPPVLDNPDQHGDCPELPPGTGGSF